MLRQGMDADAPRPATIGLTVALPLMQLFLFGFAINTNPHHLPTGLLSADQSRYERTLTAALQNTGYFDLRSFTTEAEADAALARGDVLFVLNIPPNFSRDRRSRRAPERADGRRRAPIPPRSAAPPPRCRRSTPRC